MAVSLDGGSNQKISFNYREDLKGSTFNKNNLFSMFTVGLRDKPTFNIENRRNDEFHYITINPFLICSTPILDGNTVASEFDQLKNLSYVEDVRFKISKETGSTHRALSADRDKAYITASFEWDDVVTNAITFSTENTRPSGDSVLLGTILWNTNYDRCMISTEGVPLISLNTERHRPSETDFKVSFNPRNDNDSYFSSLNISGGEYKVNGNTRNVSSIENLSIESIFETWGRDLFCTDGDPSRPNDQVYTNIRTKVEAGDTIDGESGILLNDFIFDTYEVFAPDEMVVFYPNNDKIGGVNAVVQDPQNGNNPIVLRGDRRIKRVEDLFTDDSLNNFDLMRWAGTGALVQDFKSGYFTNANSRDAIYGVTMSSHVYMGSDYPDYEDALMSSGFNSHSQIGKAYGGFDTGRYSSQMPTVVRGIVDRPFHPAFASVMRGYVPDFLKYIPGYSESMNSARASWTAHRLWAPFQFFGVEEADSSVYSDTWALPFSYRKADDFTVGNRDIMGKYSSWCFNYTLTAGSLGANIVFTPLNRPGEDVLADSVLESNSQLEWYRAMFDAVSDEATVINLMSYPEMGVIDKGLFYGAVGVSNSQSNRFMWSNFVAGGSTLSDESDFVPAEGMVQFNRAETTGATGGTGSNGERALRVRGGGWGRSFAPLSYLPNNGQLNISGSYSSMANLVSIGNVARNTTLNASIKTAINTSGIQNNNRLDLDEMLEFSYNMGGTGLIDRIRRVHIPILFSDKEGFFIPPVNIEGGLSTPSTDGRHFYNFVTGAVPSFDLPEELREVILWLGRRPGDTKEEAYYGLNHDHSGGLRTEISDLYDAYADKSEIMNYFSYQAQKDIFASRADIPNYRATSLLKQANMSMLESQRVSSMFTSEVSLGSQDDIDALKVSGDYGLLNPVGMAQFYTSMLAYNFTQGGGDLLEWVSKFFSDRSAIDNIDGNLKDMTRFFEQSFNAIADLPSRPFRTTFPKKERQMIPNPLYFWSHPLDTTMSIRETEDVWLDMYKKHCLSHELGEEKVVALVTFEIDRSGNLTHQSIRNNPLDENLNEVENLEERGASAGDTAIDGGYINGGENVRSNVAFTPDPIVYGDYLDVPVRQYGRTQKVKLLMDYNNRGDRLYQGQVRTYDKATLPTGFEGQQSIVRDSFIATTDSGLLQVNPFADNDWNVGRMFSRRHTKADFRRQYDKWMGNRVVGSV